MPDATTASSTNSPRLAATRPPRAQSRGRGAIRLLISTACTYLRRPWLWTWPLATTLLAIFVCSKISPMYDATTTGLRATDPLPYEGVVFSTFLLACSAGFLAASVTAHFIQLLAPPRGHIVPRLRAAALSANILLTVLTVVGLAMIWPHPTVHVVDPGFHQSHTVHVPFHALALAAVLAGQLAWAQFAPLFGGTSILLWMSLAFPRVHQAVILMLIGRAPALECAMALVGATLFVSLWLSLARRRDRSPGIDLLSERLPWWAHTDSPKLTNPRPFPGSIPPLAPPRLRNARQRLRLHRHAAAAGNPAALTGLLTGVLLVLWVFSFRALGIGQPDPMTPRLLCFMASIVPIMIVTATAMENRGPLLAHGLLLPAPRPQFLRELGLAMLANLLTTWLCALLPIIAWALFLTPELVRPTRPALIAMLSISAAYQILAFGATAWILRLTHRLAITFALAGLCSLGVLIIGNAILSSAYVTTTVTATLTLTGLAFTLTAYARWAHSELPSAGPSKTAAAL